MKRPAFQFYPSDWRKDAALQSCSLAAQGLWINLMCIAHECEPYGHLLVNGKPMSSAQIGRLVGLSAKEADKLMAELADAGVSSTDAQGAIFSRRMVKDEMLREARADIGRANGAKGAEHGKKGAEHGAKGGRPPKQKAGEEPHQEPPQEPRQNPLPSSSSSSSSPPSSEKEPPSPAGEAPPVAAKPRSIARPDGVAEQVWSDWLQLRKAKKAPVTQTVVDGAAREAQKAGMPLGDFLAVWCRRGSQGLEAGWLKPDERASNRFAPDRVSRQLETAALMTGAHRANNEAVTRPSETLEIFDVTPRIIPA